MKVKELAAILGTCDGDAEVRCVECGNLSMKREEQGCDIDEAFERKGKDQDDKGIIYLY